MARLNDAAAPIDPVELLRRKYSRQNKEIARINSTQCIRIRNLENEVSRLLAENLDLREQVLRSHSEFESKSDQQMFDHINTIKSALEAKLQEVGALVATLGDVPPHNLFIKTGKVVRSSPTKSLDQENWKNTCTLSETVGLQEGRLPPILEDKPYPRRTLEPAEIMGLLSNLTADDTDSPDVGPPPVSQFINEDPVKIDLPTKTDVNTEKNTEIEPSKSVHLEQREKRKDSTAPSEQKRSSRSEPCQNQTPREVAQSLKTGAKRKLSIRDDEDRAGDTKAAETSPDDFKYTRRTVEDQPQTKAFRAAERHTGKTPREFAVVKGVHREKTTSTNSSNSRRALAQKTANTDVANSPKKLSKQILLDDISSEKGEMLKKDQTKERLRERKAEHRTVALSNGPTVATISVEPEHETPATTDLFSPLEIASKLPAEARDTPPPSDIGQGIEGQRASRRARGSVSYAEPSLRDKMRRPTKEFVDAVAGEGKAQRLSIVKLETDAPTTATRIKEEPEADDAWKTMPSASLVDEYPKSPLVDVVSSRHLMLGSLVMQSQRGPSIQQATDHELLRSGSSSAISALLGGPRKFRPESSEDKDFLDKAMARLDIYEFTGSSPGEFSDSRVSAVKSDWHVSRTSKRSSSKVQDQASTNTTESSDGEQSNRARKTSSRRRQSMMGLRGSGSNAGSDGQRQLDELKRSNSHTILSESSEVSTRNERLGARRRSMML